MDILLVIAALFVAFYNGANDNFKGLATVWGAETLSYRLALTLATVATLAGCIASWLLADTLVQQFSGRGLLPNEIASAPSFVLSVAVGAAFTVFLATQLGFPISTTHALIGALVGAGLGQANGEVHFAKLTQTFLLPLLISPLIAASLGIAVYKLLRMRATAQDCACLVSAEPSPFISENGAILRRIDVPQLVIADVAACKDISAQARWSISRIMDQLHVASALSICFARGLNDTPKLAALLITAKAFERNHSVAMIGIVMALGGLISARKVAETMSHRINRMDPTQGLAANLITATLVIFASKIGMPVSTTHVSVGSIAGVGANAQTLNWHALRNVLFSWVATLPLAAVTAWLAAKFV